MDELEKRIIWLAGLTDGEGTITVFTHKSQGFQRYTAIYCLANTNPEIINEVQKILNELGVSSYINEIPPQKANHRVAFQLSTRKMVHVKILLERLLPYLIGKKAQAEITLRFVNSRLLRMGTGKHNSHSPYNEEEIEISTLLYKLNKKGCSESSETIRQTLEKSKDDIVRTDMRVSELALSN